MTKCGKYIECIVEHHDVDARGNERTRYKFPNGFGASVIHGRTSYGLEVAVLEYDDQGNRRMTYDTPLTDDVIAHVDDLEVVLDAIYELEGR